MRRRSALLLLVALAFGFSMGWAFTRQAMDHRELFLSISGKQQDGAFEDLKSKIAVDQLPWISPTTAAASCGIKGFTANLATEGVEHIFLPLKSLTSVELDCLFFRSEQSKGHNLGLRLTEFER